jgi:hypothetical protein
VSEHARADAAGRAAATLGVRPPFDSSHAVAIVYPRFERRAEILKVATVLRTPWMADVVARLRSDSMLIAAASAASRVTGEDSDAALVVARTTAGSPVVTAMQGVVEGRGRLVLLPSVDAGSLISAALIAATARALSTAPPLTELEPATLPDNVLQSWQREPASTTSPTDAENSSSDGRWFWLLALTLLAVETWLRRPRAEPVMSNVQHDRAA